jgi:hypothetical protein
MARRALVEQMPLLLKPGFFAMETQAKTSADLLLVSLNGLPTPSFLGQPFAL